MSPEQLSIKWHKRLGGNVIFGHTIRQLEDDIQAAINNTWEKAAKIAESEEIINTATQTEDWCFINGFSVACGVIALKLREQVKK